MDATNIPSTITLSAEGEARLVFWNSPDDSIHAPNTIAAVTELALSTLTNLRCTGDGPAFIKRGARVWYRKSAVVAWLGEGEVQA